MSFDEDFETMFGRVPLMAILRGMGVERSIALATTAWDLGIESVEVPLQTPVIQKVEIVVTSNSSPSRIARVVEARLANLSRNRRSSPYVPNYSSRDEGR